MRRIEEKCNVDNKDSVKLRFVTRDLSKENGILPTIILYRSRR